MNQLLTIKEATKWAAMFLQRQVSTSNISYLIQYGRIRKLHICYRNKSWVELGQFKPN